MKLLPPRDNALFLRYWWPATRPSRLLPVIVLLVLTLALAMFGCYMAFQAAPIPAVQRMWPRVAFGIIVGIQAFILFFVGSYQVGAAAYQEATTGAIDFHRASATSPANQMLGLVFGPATMSWILFAVAIPFTLVCALLLDDAMSLGAATVGGYAAVLVSLVLTGVFFHTLSAVIGLTAKKNALSAAQQAGSVFAVLSVLGVSIPMSLSAWSLAGFLTSLPVVGIALGGAREIRSAVFGVPLPPLLVQIAVQAPLIAIAGAALRRAFAHPNRPALSKSLALGLAACLFGLFAATYYSGVRYLGTGVGALTHEGRLAALSVLSLLFALILGMAAIFAITPQHALYGTGLRRRRKLNLSGLRPLDDTTGNSAWALMYAALAAAFYIALERGSPGLPLAPLAATLLYFGGFAAAAEYFRLWPAKRSGALFAVTMAALYALIPAFAFTVLLAQGRWVLWVQCLLSTSPVWGIAAPWFLAEARNSYPPSAANADMRNAPSDAAAMAVVLGVNALVLLLFAWLAASARARAAEVARNSNLRNTSAE